MSRCAAREATIVRSIQYDRHLAPPLRPSAVPLNRSHLASSEAVRFGAPRETICTVSAPPDTKTEFGELMAAYSGPIRRLCGAYAPNAADGEDLFQDVWVAVWRALPAFRGDSSARTWLYRIAHNVALSWQVRDRRRQRRETRLDEDVDIEVSDERDLRRLALTRAVASLSPADRTLTLLWLEGLSAVEIEDVTGVKSATVAVRLSRIRKHLTPGGSHDR
jgi:RNA polymerase sigma factor (sigma-70 family)